MTTASPSTGGFLKPRVTSKTHPKVDDGDILAFFQQLSTLFRSGTPIYDSLTISATQSQSDALADIIRAVSEKVAAGAALCQALAGYPKYFKQEWIEVIRSGEDSGQLGNVLERLTTQIDAASQLRSTIVSAMMYPIIILVVAVAAIIVMLVKVVPTFAAMFDSFGKELPAITQYVLAVSDFLQERGFMLLMGVAVLVFSLRRYLRTPKGRANRDRVFIGLPMIGDVMVQVCMQKYANNIAVLLRAGLPLLDAIQSLKGIFSDNTVYEAGLARASRHVEQGGTLADGLEETGLFTSFVISMTRIGEDSGTLPEVLDEVEVFYRRKITVLVQRLTGTMETAVILFMGITVAVILCSVYLPMFSMAGGVG